VILNWRAVCGTAAPAARRALVLLRHPQRRAEDDARDGTELLPALGIGAFVEKTLVARRQCTKVDPAGPPAAGLLGCGVMAGIGAAINTGAVAAATRSPSSAAAASATPRSPGRAGRRADDHRRRHRRPEAGVGQGFGATHTINSPEPTPSRRSRR
jgi:S-(hydroxymethyl)mycothiol dehydrogenase